MKYVSHVIDIPYQHPFDKEEFRFLSFIGEFVQPIIAEQKHELYWFSYYGDYARFRIYTEKYDEIRLIIQENYSKLNLSERDEERNLTLIQDLGTNRFLAASRDDKQPEARALLVLKYLHSIAELICDNLIKRPDGYWELETSNDLRENPNGNNFESLHHLFWNMTHVPISILLAGDSGVLLGTYWGVNSIGQREINLNGQEVIEIYLQY